jgi:hypothetical protein
LQGEQFSSAAQALRDGDLDAADITPAEAKLLEFVETQTRHAYRVTDEQVQGLRDAGWTDAQIAEAAYVGALFNLFVRLADTFGIEPPAMYEPDGVPAAARHEKDTLAGELDIEDVSAELRRLDRRT